ncbi:MAG: transposase [Bdellovibrionota bacterium]
MGRLSDALAIDIAMAKYCDLMPIQRFVKAAERMGIMALPPQSLIESTHQLSQFVRSVYKLIKQEVLNSKVLHADETPHRMLEGDERERWYLWGFATKIAAYFDIRDTRSGDVASELLKQSVCEYLSSDVFSGYGQAVRQTNEFRVQKGFPLIRNVYCNAHSRRNFKKAQNAFGIEAKYFLDQYRSIYYLESHEKFF